MYSAERQQEILKLIDQNARVSVAELAAAFGVSRASIRRDLSELHAHGLLQRTYGGAMRYAANSSEPPFHEREVSHHEEKDHIGRYAASLVGPSDTILIDGGTTTECMVPYLPDRSTLTVATYGLNIVEQLVNTENTTVIVVGGTLQRRSLTFGGVLADEGFQAFHIYFDKVFIATSGIAAEAGLTNASFEEIPLKRKAINSTRQTIVLADSSKVGAIAAGLIAPISKVHRLVTTDAAPEAAVARLRAAGVTVDLV